MKKSLLTLFGSATAVFLVAFTLMSLSNNSEGTMDSTYEDVDFIASDAIPVPEAVIDEETGLSFTENDVWEHFDKKMSPKLSRFVSYEEGEIFSRCPSGLGQFFDQEESFASTAIGEIVVWQGCSDEHYCYYKVDMTTKETFIKVEEDNDYMAFADFIVMEEERTFVKF